MRSPALARSFVAAAAATAVLAAAPAGAYVRETTTAPGNYCLWWRGRTVTYQVNAAAVTATGCNDVSGAGAAIAAGFEPWSVASTTGASSACTDFHFVNGGATSRNTIGRDGVNLVVVRTKRCSTATGAELQNCWPDEYLIGSAGTIAYTTTYFDSATGEILDSDMEIFAWDGVTGGADAGHYLTCADPSAGTCSPPNAGHSCNQVDLTAVVTHEAGHMLGLAHVSDPSSIMAPQVGNVSQRGLSQDDVAGVCTIYPKLAPTLTCAPPAAKKSTGGCASAGAAGLLPSAVLGAWLAARVLRRRRAAAR